MSELVDSFSAQGLHVLALNLDEEPAQADAFIARLAPRFTIVRGDNTQCASAFEVQTMPSSYVIDRAGRVRLVHHGFRAADDAALRDVIESVLAETADVDEAAQ
jgi:peroxiredoxin